MRAQTPYRDADPLGALISEHPVSIVQQGIRIGVGLFCILVALDCVALPLFFMPKHEAVELTGLLVFGGAALVFGALGIWAFSHFVRARGQRVEVHEEGLRIGRGKDTRDVRFHDITSVGGLFWEALGDAPPEVSALWIDDREGNRLRLPTPVRGPYALGRELTARTFEHRLEEAERRIQEEGRMLFGRCMLDEMRLFLGEGNAVWRQDVLRAKLSSRWIEVRLARGGKRLVPTEEVPDADVLLVMLRPKAEA
ncbi:hypothetical protein [Polyangium jinanense]|uniref:Uncharacterized protein n=1 Tax=Polyangium jinanense TaxID=2829994 RepID=A0A9X3XH97_9BACT|nr:hypothetical protein [Polyangium jinanense]MDC3962270.1 hypothetical protein [Polyangium jinanense]MDC3962557.1 hypothetical protein [Polyangium jinanense]MDC3989415.1 hypothetical protein [Polyangium jinanense]